MTAAPPATENATHAPWTSGVLVAAVVTAHAPVVGGVVLWAVPELFGGNTPTVAAWCVATFVVAATLPPSYRWIRDGVEDLLAGPAAPGASPFATMSTELAGPLEVLTALAGTIREALDVAAVTIEVQPSHTGSVTAESWAAGATVTVGPELPTSIEVPLSHGGQGRGSVRVALRGRAGRGGSALHLLVDLARQVALVVSSELLREELEASRERLVLAREEERRRIRRNLHDGLGPSLAGIRLQVGALRRQLEPLGHDLNAIDEIRNAVGEATDEVRRVVEDLRPPLLDDCGLVEAVRNLRIVPPELQLHVDAPSAMPALPAAVEVALYRIAVEAVHNTVRHAAATQCAVEFRVDESHATLFVTDDGRGLPVPARTGVGTAAMTKRASELGGTVSIEQTATGGTCVTDVLPLRERMPK
ncbi:hypothetical protein BH10ACT3_BH10ACT3_24180 [soil metagenome]